MTTTRNTMQQTLPKGWKMVRLGEVCEFVYGDSLPERKRQVGNVPVFGSNGIVGTHDSPISNGESIIIGRKGSVGEINFSPDSCFPIDTTYFIDKRHTQQNIKWLYWSLKSLKLDSLSLTVGVPGLNRKDAYKVKIPLPPLPTQHKIVEILEEADNLRKLRRQVNEKMKDLIPSLFVQMFGDPARNPKGWEVKEMGEICSIKGGKRLPKGAKFSSQVADFPYIRVSDFKDGSVDTSNLMYLDEGIQNQIKRYIINKTDVYISIAGTIGLVGIIPDGLDGANLTENAAKLVINNSSLVMHEYLARFLQTPIGQSQIKQRTNAVGQPKLALERIATIKIPLPPLPLQQEFAKLVEDIETEKARQAESGKKLDELFQSLMQRAFTGELVA